MFDTVSTMAFEEYGLCNLGKSLGITPNEAEFSDP